MGYFVKNRRLQSGSSGVVLPTGSSAQRPDNPAFGLIRYNTDSSGFVEFFNGTQYVALSSGNVEYTVDNFVGNGVQTDFTMTVAESTATQIIVFVGSIYQEPTTAYTVNGSVTLTFTSAPPNTVPVNVIHTSS
jgi:stress response protein SCP2